MSGKMTILKCVAMTHLYGKVLTGFICTFQRTGENAPSEKAYVDVGANEKCFLTHIRNMTNLFVFQFEETVELL
jgi:hypothetical protein